MLLMPVLVIAAPATDFSMQDMQGHTHQLSQYRGQWLIVNYWAPWCPPCLEETPELEAFYSAHRQRNVAVIGVAVQYETVKSVRDFVEDNLVSYPIVLGEAQKHALPRPEVLPTSYIYRPDGSLYAIKRGILHQSWLESLIGDTAQRK